ncbi:hypothetical protein [Bacteroides acidifaciens]|nr:hypothetical protein [Bacteroides acidifaciens]
MVERHMSRKKRLKAIWKIISGINDSWILWQVHRFAVNITEEEKGGAA